MAGKAAVVDVLEVCTLYQAKAWTLCAVCARVDGSTSTSGSHLHEPFDGLLILTPDSRCISSLGASEVRVMQVSSADRALGDTEVLPSVVLATAGVADALSEHAAKVLRRRFRTHVRAGVELFVASSGNSSELCERVCREAEVPFAIGWRGVPDEDTRVQFVSALFSAMFVGKSYEAAFVHARDKVAGSSGVGAGADAVMPILARSRACCARDAFPRLRWWIPRHSYSPSAKSAVSESEDESAAFDASESESEPEDEPMM